MVQHAKFSPSAAHRWMNCPGSWGLEQHAPKSPPGESAMIGTIVHAMIERVLRNRGNSAAPFLDKIGVCNENGNFVEIYDNATQVPPGQYGFEIDQQMVNGANVCINLVKGILKKRPRAKLLLEQRYEIILDLVYGYADITILDFENDWGCVIDYKNGVNHVEVEENPQLMLYAVGAAICGEDEPTDWVIALCQPNDKEDSRPVRTWKTDINSLTVFMADVEKAVQKCKIAYASDDNEQYFVIGSWCQWCKGQNQCPAQKRALLKTAQLDLPDLPDAGTNPARVMKAEALTNEQLAWLADNGPMMKKMIDSASAEMLNRMLNGEKITGYKVVQSRTQRKIADKAGLEKAAEREGWEIWERKLKGLGKLDKEVPKAQLAQFVIKPEGAPTWAPETDKRPALEIGAASLPELEL